MQRLMRRDRAHAQEALSLHPTHNMSGRALQQLWRISAATPIMRSVMPLLSRPMASDALRLIRWCEQVLADNDHSVRTVIGGVVKHRRSGISIIVLVDTTGGRVVAKLTNRREDAQQAEAFALGSLSGQPVSFRYPRLKFAARDSQASILVTEYVPPSPTARHQVAPHAYNVVLDLTKIGVHDGGDDYVGDLRCRLSGWPTSPLRDRLDAAVELLGSTVLAVASSHGDLAPWNLLVKDAQIMVHDWEFAGYRPLGWDLVHYRLQTTVISPMRRRLICLRHVRSALLEDVASNYYRLADAVSCPQDLRTLFVAYRLEMAIREMKMYTPEQAARRRRTLARVLPSDPRFPAE